ncbi:MAG: HypC/HybG/HupF family hydrogenase formation chaperone [Candidatus Hydrogenedentota bacterium]
MCLAVPGEIVGMEKEDPLTRTGRVRFGGVTRTVSLAMVPEAAIGDYVLVHAGLAISTVDENEANEILDALGEIDAANQEPAG